MGPECKPPDVSVDDDLESVYLSVYEEREMGRTPILQNIQKLRPHDDLFYADVKLGGKITVRALLDSGSMACTLSSSVIPQLLQHAVLKDPILGPTDTVLIGCGGSRTLPSGVCDLEMELCGCKVIVPTLVVDVQCDELIVGSNLLRYVISKLKLRQDLQDQCPTALSCGVDARQRLLSLMAGVEEVPDMVGTVKMKTAVTLEPMTEHLVWGKLQRVDRQLTGSTVVIEPTTARARPRTVMVGRTVTFLREDGWLPLKVINPSDKPVTLRRNAKLADVSICASVEILGGAQPSVWQQVQLQTTSSTGQSLVSEASTLPDHPQSRRQRVSAESHQAKLCTLGLSDIDIESCEVSAKYKERLTELVVEFESIFSRDKLDCGKATGCLHRIRVMDEKPFRLPCRRIPPTQYEKLRQALNEMEEREIIRKSNSEFASPLVLVWKKTGDLRICNDFRWLNARTIKDAHPLPHPADALSALGGNAFFSTMDLTSGYYNVEVHEADRKYTAFSSPFGLYEYNRMPQGLCNSPATFMRMMLSVFGDQNFMSLLCYLDDVLVFAPTEDLALERLEMVFRRLQAHNLKLAPRKCNFLRRSVKFLGHVISADGIQSDPDKVVAITSLTESDLMEDGTDVPSQRKVRSFLGMVVYYQQFIEGCSAMAKPLFRLTSGSKGPRGSGRKQRYVRRKLSATDWTQEFSKAFCQLKQALLDHVVLAHPKFDEPFLLSVDASTDGLGAVLSQVPAGGSTARPIAFASKSLSYAQSKYPAHRLEFFALKWAVCDKFHHWLRGHQFTVWTDNNPLTYILSKARLDACEQRWVAKLAPFQFDIKYIPGPRNVVADALSREPFVLSSTACRLTKVPYDKLLAEATAVGTSGVQEAFRWAACPPDVSSECGQPVASQCVAVSESGAVTSQEVVAVLEACRDRDSSVCPHAFLLPQFSQTVLQLVQTGSGALSHDVLKERQRRDIVLNRVIFFVERGRRPSRRERVRESAEVLKLLRSWEKLKMRDGVLYRVAKNAVTKKKTYLFVVPLLLRNEVLKGVHDEAGHQGQQRTLYLTRQRFHWIGLAHDVMEYVKCCRRCVVSKSAEPEARAPLENIRTSEPLELVSIDFWSAEVSANKSLDVLVITDHFTKMAHAFLCPNQSAKAVAHQLWNNYFCIYGFPRRLHSDQGANFESALIAELLNVAGVQKSHTTPYHPMGNGSCERMNRTLGNMIRALPPRAKHRWPEALKSLTFAYNCTVHETTGYAPFLLMFGRVPRLPVDVIFGSVLDDPEVVDYDRYIESLRRDMREAMYVAQTVATKQLQRHTNLYNRRVRGAPVDIDDRVLLANKGERGKRKLADRWENTVYVVVEKNEECHTFKIRNPITDQVKVVHRNLIMPVNFLPLPEPDIDAQGEVAASPYSSSLDLSTKRSVVSGVLDSTEFRTRIWVSDLPSVEGDDTGVEDVGQLEDDAVANVTEAADVQSTCDQLRPSEATMMEGSALASSCSPNPLTCPETIVTSDHTLPTTAIETVDEWVGDRTSRAGRLLRPVTRLIEIMHQTPGLV